MTDYIEAQDIVDHLMEQGLMDGDDGDYQPLLEACATRVSRAIDARFGYPDGSFAVSVATARYFDGNGEAELRVDHMADAPTEVAVAEGGDITSLTVWESTDYILYPLNAVDEGRPYRSLLIDAIGGTKFIWYNFPKAVKITAKWGWSATCPDILVEAAIIQASRWFKRGQQAFQDAGAVTELMSLRYLKKIDPDVELMLKIMPGGITI